jgi:type III secretion protein V
MVSQIPSLLISVAAGVMITRVGDDSPGAQERSLGEDITRQFGGSSRALYFAAVLLLGFAIVPGFPAPLFLLLSGLLAFVGYRLQKKTGVFAARSGKPVSSLQRAGAKGDAPSILPRPPQFTCPIGVRMSKDLSSRLVAEALDQAFDTQRAALQAEVGLPFPGIMMWTDEALPADTYEVVIYDVPHARSSLAAEAGEPAELTALIVLIAKEPGAPQAAFGAVPRKAETIIAQHTIALLRKNAHLFLGIQETQWMLDQLEVDYPGLVAEVQKALPLQKMADVMRRLLEEQVPIRNIRSITESLITWGPKEKDMLMLTEYIRIDLGRMIAYRATGGPRNLPAVLVDVQVEQHIRQSIKQTPTGNFLVGESPRGQLAVIASMDIRRYVKRMIESRLAWLPVYSYQELGAHIDLQPVGRLMI